MRELPVNWNEIEKACIAGVPQRQVAQTMGESSGVDVERLYKAIRKRSSRERWPVPSSIIRRAQLQSLVASGKAANAKDAATWKQGEPGWEASATCAAMAGQPVLSVAELEKQEQQKAPSVTLQDARCGEAGAVCGAVCAGVALGAGGAGLNGGGVALREASPSAHDLVTQDLAALGNRGLRAILSRSVKAVEAITEAPAIRSWNDIQVAAKVISQAAGLDKPGVAIAVSLNSGQNASITAWESVDSV